MRFPMGIIICLDSRNPNADRKVTNDFCLGQNLWGFAVTIRF